MTPERKFRCQACGFQIFNRRVPKCEACGNLLPKELLFTTEEIAALDARHEQSQKDREKAKRKSRNSNDSGGSSGGGDFGNMDADGDGGGCD
jgi:hypothetical protein